MYISFNDGTNVELIDWRFSLNNNGKNFTKPFIFSTESDFEKISTNGIIFKYTVSDRKYKLSKPDNTQILSYTVPSNVTYMLHWYDSQEDGIKWLAVSIATSSRTSSGVNIYRICATDVSSLNSYYSVYSEYGTDNTKKNYAGILIEPNTLGVYTEFDYQNTDAFQSFMYLPNAYGSIPNLVSLLEESFTEEDPDDPTDDPYNPGGTDTPGGGQGNFDDTSDDVVDPLIPPGLEDHSAINSGFVKLYNPDTSQLATFSSWMWSGTWTIESFKKVFNTPFETILGLTTIPVQPVVSADPSPIMVGNLQSNASAKVIQQQYFSKAFGSLDVLEYWGCYLDYNPYTSIDLYLPYIGYIPIDPDDYMGTTMKVRYTIDVLSGELLAIITARDLVMQQIAGSCAQQLPLTASNHDGILKAAASAALTIVSTLATIQAGTSVSDGAGGEVNKPLTESQRASVLGSGAASSAKSIMTMKERYNKSGGMVSSAGHMGVRYPYVIYRRARQSLPVGLNSFTGYPSNLTKMISACSGFTKVDAVNLIAPSATEPEVNEILQLLKSGVII